MKRRGTLGIKRLLPKKGTQEVEIEDNMGLGPTVQFYFLLQGIHTAGITMCKDMGIRRDSDDWNAVVDTMLKLVKAELVEKEEE